MTREEAIDKLNWALDNNMIEDVQSAYDYITAIKMAIEALEQEPCDKCEVGNPCLYCKHEFEPKESEVENDE